MNWNFIDYFASGDRTGLPDNPPSTPARLTPSSGPSIKTLAVGALALYGVYAAVQKLRKG